MLHEFCLNQVRSRGLPDDHAGPIRIIDIEGVDANMCCGTHVSNLSHLQVHLHTSMPHIHLHILHIYVIFVTFFFICILGNKATGN